MAFVCVKRVVGGNGIPRDYDFIDLDAYNILNGLPQLTTLGEANIQCGLHIPGGSYASTGQYVVASDQSSIWDLTPEQGASIVGAMLLPLSIAWAFRMLARFISTSDGENQNA